MSANLFQDISRKREKVVLTNGKEVMLRPLLLGDFLDNDAAIRAIAGSLASLAVPGSGGEGIGSSGWADEASARLAGILLANLNSCLSLITGTLDAPGLSPDELRALLPGDALRLVDGFIKANLELFNKDLTPAARQVIDNLVAVAGKAGK